MSLHCCPVCAIMPPVGVALSSAAMSGAFQNPILWQGRHTRVYSIVRQTGCGHGPVVPPSARTSEVESPWNEWVKEEAEPQAEERQLTGNRKREFLYHLGLTTLQEGILTPPPQMQGKAQTA